MKLASLSSWALAVSALLGLSASPVFASTCTINNRALPANFVTDAVRIECDSLAGQTAEGGVAIQNVNGIYNISADLRRGAASQFTKTELLNAAGAVICSVTDSTVNNGPNAVACNVVGAASWRGFQTFNN